MIILLRWENVSLALKPSAGRIESIILDKFLLLHNEKELFLIPMISDVGILKTTRNFTVRVKRFMFNFGISGREKKRQSLHYVFSLSFDISSGSIRQICRMRMNKYDTMIVVFFLVLRFIRGPLRDLGLRVSTAYFDGFRAPKDKIAVLQGSIACSSGLQGLYFLKFVKIAKGNV